MDYVEGYAPVYGGTIPAGIWHDFMSAALWRTPVINFATPTITGTAHYAPDLYAAAAPQTTTTTTATTTTNPSPPPPPPTTTVAPAPTPPQHGNGHHKH